MYRNIYQERPYNNIEREQRRRERENWRESERSERAGKKGGADKEEKKKIPYWAALTFVLMYISIPLTLASPRNSFELSVGT